MFMSPTRIKAIKDLVIEKLDVLIANSEKLDGFLENRSAAETADASALENDSSIMEALTFLINRIQEGSTVNVEYLAALLNRVERVQQEVAFIRASLKLENSSQYQTYDFVEVDLMIYLYSFLPSRVALDIGANIGDVTEGLLDAGYEVIAFEPNLPVFEQLQRRFGNRKGLQLHHLAIGRTDATMQLHIAEDFSPTNIYKDSTLYSSLILHSMPEKLQFTRSSAVKVRSLESLHNSMEIPSEIGLLKIDAEGFDLEIIRGMGEQVYPVVVAEYWDKEMPFARGEAYNRLDDLVVEMRDRGYWWHIVVHRDEDKGDIGFYCNSPRSVPNSWGNIFFFREQSIFFQALSWCSKSIPRTSISHRSK